MPPDTPTIDGPLEGQVRERHIYHISSDDPDNNPVSYFVDWGDGNIYGWTRDYEPGLTVSYGHSWFIRGAYTIKVKARDTFGAESDWAYLEVTMPVNQQYQYPLFHWFLECFPNALPILRNLIGL